MRKDDVFKHIRYADEMMTADFFGVDLAPVLADPYKEWLVLPGDSGFARPDNEERAEALMKTLGMDYHEFTEFATQVMHAVVDGENEKVFDEFRPFFEKVIKEYGEHGVKASAKRRVH